jgi:hypothetical protein
VKPSEKYRRNQQLVLKKRRDAFDKMLSFYERHMCPPNLPQPIIWKKDGLALMQEIADRQMEEMTPEDRKDALALQKAGKELAHALARDLANNAPSAFDAMLSMMPIIERPIMDPIVANSVAISGDSVAVPVAIYPRKVANVANNSIPVADFTVSERAKLAADGFYHCSQCDYITDKAKNLWMHKRRRH